MRELAWPYDAAGDAADFTSLAEAQRIVQIDLSPVDTYTYSTRTGTGRRDISISSLPISSTGGAGDDPTLISGSRVTIKVPAGRVGWREIKNFGG